MRFKVPRRQPESFRASALYLAGEIKGLSPDRVEFVEVRNLFTDNARGASAVMEATAAKSVRCKQPAYHFMITFDPKDAAAGKVTPELIKSLFDVHAPRVKRMQQAELATEAFMNASQQRRVTERNTGVDAWKWLFRETAKTVGGVLDDIGANYFK